MLTDMLLGIKDALKNKMIALSFFAITASLLIVLVAATLSFKDDLSMTEGIGYMHLVPIKFVDEKGDEGKNILEKLDSVYKDGGIAMFTTVYKSSKVTTDLNVLVCNGGEYIWILPEREYNSYFKGDVKGDIITLKQVVDDLVYQGYDREWLNYFFYEQESICIKIKDDKYKRFEDYSISILDIDSIVEGTYFSKEDIKNGVVDKFIQVFKDSSFYLKVNKITKDFKEMNFIIRYVLIYVIFIILEIISVLFIFLEHIKNKMHKVFMIHITYGARKRDIIIRNFTMSFVVISADILILFYLNRFRWDFAAALIVVISLFFLLIMLIANVIATLNDDFLSERSDRQ